MSTVIIVDDSEIELSIFTHALKNAGYDCIGITDPNSALETIQTKQPDFVLLDYSMPEKNGLDLCRDIKMNPLTRNIPIMFLTSDSDPENIIATMHLGCIDYIRKPVEAQEIVDLLIRHEVGMKIKEALAPLKKHAQEIVDKYDRRKRGGRV
jgi:putative two-component system response regulator